MFHFLNRPKTILKQLTTQTGGYSTFIRVYFKQQINGALVSVCDSRTVCVGFSQSKLQVVCSW